jgi:hypothetical protein
MDGHPINGLASLGIDFLSVYGILFLGHVFEKFIFQKFLHLRVRIPIHAKEHLAQGLFVLSKVYKNRRLKHLKN